MASEEKTKIPRIFSMLWGELMLQKEFYAATSLALIASALSKDDRYQLNQTTIDEWLDRSVAELQPARQRNGGSELPSCSFCGLRPPDVRLAVGGGRAFICDSCVGTLADAFRTP